MEFKINIKEKIKIEKYIEIDGMKTEYEIFDLLETLECLYDGNSMRLDKSLYNFLNENNLIHHDGLTYSSVCMNYENKDDFFKLLERIKEIAYSEDDK